MFSIHLCRLNLVSNNRLLAVVRAANDCFRPKDEDNATDLGLLYSRVNKAHTIIC
jgi:hypothetical protein